MLVEKWAAVERVARDRGMGTAVKVSVMGCRARTGPSPDSNVATWETSWRPWQGRGRADKRVT